MSDDLWASLKEAFDQRLREAVAELQQYTRAGLGEALESIRSIGGLETAKHFLRSTDGDSALARVVNRPSPLFWAAVRADRIDLSLEAFVLDPKWVLLFTQKELETAAARLKENGYNLPLERVVVPHATEVTVRGQPFSRFTLRKRSWADFLDENCESTARQSAALREGKCPSVSFGVREHLGSCSECRKLHSELLAAYEQFDQEALQALLRLLENFEATLRLSDADLKRFFFNEPEDFGGDIEQYNVAFEMFLEGARPVFAWRATRLGRHIAGFMSAFASTFIEGGDLWLKWRTGEVGGPVSDFVRRMDDEAFALGLTATNLRLLGRWPHADEDFLFLPSDGDLKSVPGLVQVEQVPGFGLEEEYNDWKDLLGPPPEDLNLMGVLYLTYQAALSRAQTTKTAVVNGPGNYAVLDEMASMKAMLQAGFEAQQIVLDEIRARQDAEIAQLERMVAYMSSTDRIACEEALVREFGDLYGRLDAAARCQLLAAEQVYRVPGFAAPGKVVHALATAFEIQIRTSLMPGLFGYLKAKGIPKLFPPPDWEDSERQRAIYSPSLKSEKLDLGHMERLLRHPESTIAEYFDLISLARDDVREATRAVLVHRNNATHANRPFDIGEAEAIRNDWLRWGGRPGGIFAVLFRAE